MAAKSSIEWTDATWNPIRGCSRVSEGCRHCYAERMGSRFSGDGQAYNGLAVMQHGKPHWTGHIEFVEGHLLDPLKWGPVIEHAEGCSGLRMRGRRTCNCATRPRRIFVNSMSDLFHENVTDEMRDKIFAVMALCPQHTLQVLTKRPARMLEYFTTDGVWHHIKIEAESIARLRKMPIYWSAHRSPEWLDHVWLGVSVEDQKTADKRIPLLLQTPAAVRFISAEPLLGPVDLTVLRRAPSDFDRAMPGFDRCKDFYSDALNGFNGVLMHDGKCFEEPEGSMSALDWVICGGESGPGARPMHPEWARGLRDQCEEAGVPFFFKQWGEWIAWEPEQEPCWKSQYGKSEDAHALFPENIADDPPGWDCGLGYDEEDAAAFQRVGKHAAGSLLDGLEWKQFPEVAR